MPKLVDADERRSELALAAARVIARSGVGAATLREVAAEAGWTTGALTHYFTDKRDLLRFTFEASLERRRAHGAGRAHLTAAEALRATLVDALPIEHGTLLHWTVTVAFCAQAAADPALALIQRDAYRQFRTDIARLVERAGRSDAPGARVEAERLIAVLDGVALQTLFDPESWPAQRQIAAIDVAILG